MRLRLIENYNLLEAILDPSYNDIDADDLAIIRSSNNSDDIHAATAKYINKKYENLIEPIVRSVIEYRSLNLDKNPFLAILEKMEKIITSIDDGTAYNIFDAISNIRNIYDIIQYFDPKYKLYACTDLKYMINLLSILADPRQRKKYKNSSGEEPNIDLLLKGGSFLPNTNSVKKQMDAFLSDAELLSLDEWFKNEKIDPQKHKETLINYVKSANISELKDEELKTNLLAYLDKLYSKGEEKARQIFLRELEIPESIKASSNNAANEVSKAIIEYMKSNDNVVEKSASSKSIEQIMLEKGLKTFPKIIKEINRLIAADKTLFKDDQKSATFKLKLLLDSSKKALSDKLLDIQVPDGDITKISKLVMSFLQEAIKQNYLYTTIEEALALTGLQPAEGYQKLASYIFAMDSDIRPNYLARFKKVWDSKNDLRKQLLAARITKTQNGFAWQAAIKRFLDNIKI